MTKVQKAEPLTRQSSAGLGDGGQITAGSRDGNQAQNT